MIAKKLKIKRIERVGMTKYWAGVAIVAGLLNSFYGIAAFAASDEYELVIKDHQFSPKTLEVPAGRKIKLIVKNEDATAEEFESYDLNREKVVAGNAKITVFVGPLMAKTYKFFGDFHPDTAQGGHHSRS